MSNWPCGGCGRRFDPRAEALIHGRSVRINGRPLCHDCGKHYAGPPTPTDEERREAADKIREPGAMVRGPVTRRDAP